MDSRERVAKCLNHQEPDRVPIDFWATNEIKSKLLEYFQTTDIEDVLQHFEVDFRYIEGPRYIRKNTVRPDGAQEDHYGVPRKVVTYGKGKNAGAYSEVVEYPLQKVTTLAQIDNYPKWPKADWFDYECVREQAQAARETGKVVVFMGDRLNRCAQLKPAMYVRGVDQILLDFILNPDIAKRIFQRITDFYAEYLHRTLLAAEGNIDIVFTGDDFGTQDNLFMAPDMWRNLLREGFKRFIDIAHEYNCKVIHHTCGSIAQLIPDFIECGLDILNPLQPEVNNMDYLKIIEKFGSHICFHGGISIQKTMPYGTVEDVRNEVKDRVQKLAPGGGYIFCTAHNIQVDTSLENITALFSAYKEFGRYS
ncbi:uroporphyrinogen decarboxylase family protein [Bacteroidota bacterium]